jgi:hypothetical protein
MGRAKMRTNDYGLHFGTGSYIEKNEHRRPALLGKIVASFPKSMVL